MKCFSNMFDHRNLSASHTANPNSHPHLPLPFLVNRTLILFGQQCCQPQTMNHDRFYGNPDKPAPLLSSHFPGLHSRKERP